MWLRIARFGSNAFPGLGSNFLLKIFCLDSYAYAKYNTNDTNFYTNTTNNSCHSYYIYDLNAFPGLGSNFLLKIFCLDSYAYAKYNTNDTNFYTNTTNNSCHSYYI